MKLKLSKNFNIPVKIYEGKQLRTIQMFEFVRQYLKKIKQKGQILQKQYILKFNGDEHYNVSYYLVSKLEYPEILCDDSKEYIIVKLPDYMHKGLFKLGWKTIEEREYQSKVFCPIPCRCQIINTRDVSKIKCSLCGTKIEVPKLNRIDKNEI